MQNQRMAIQPGCLWMSASLLQKLCASARVGHAAARRQLSAAASSAVSVVALRSKPLLALAVAFLGLLGEADVEAALLGDGSRRSS